jgi:hypothetical protein
MACTPPGRVPQSRLWAGLECQARALAACPPGAVWVHALVVARLMSDPSPHQKPVQQQAVVRRQAAPCPCPGRVPQVVVAADRAVSAILVLKLEFVGIGLAPV